MTKFSKQFKASLCFDSASKMTEAIIEEEQDIKLNMEVDGFDEGLLDSSWGQLLVCHPEGGRLEEAGFGSAIDIYGSKYPTLSQLQYVYEEVIKTGVTEFTIYWDSMVRAYDSWKDKFGGYHSEPTEYFVEVELLKYN